MKVEIGTKVYVPVYGREVTVSKMENNRPTYGTYIDDNGKTQVVDLVVTTWEFISIVKKIWGLIKLLFKRN